MDKTEALKLVGDLAQATRIHYQVGNGIKRGKEAIAAGREFDAAQALLSQLIPNEKTTRYEVETALGW